jgi:hypothetical protein
MRRLIILFAIILCIGFSNNLFSQENDDLNSPLLEKTEEIDSVYTSKTTYRNPAIATLLSLAYPGIGQYYNGQKSKAEAFIAWKLLSDAFVIIAATGDPHYYPRNEFNVGKVTYITMFLASFTSAATCWIVGMVDANRNAKKINKYNGFTNPNENKPQISINPDIKIIPQPFSPTTQTLSPSFGLNLSLSF